MSIDLKLNACGDLAIESGDLALISGRAEVLQRIIIYLKTWLGGYFYDTLKGIDYPKIFEKGITEDRIKEIFRKVIFGIEGIDRVQEIVLKEYDAQERNIKIDIFVIINDTLEFTTLEYKGYEESICDIELPFTFSEPLIWFDMSCVDNLFDWPGSYSLIGTAVKTGGCLIKPGKHCINVNNPNGNEENYISFEGTPFIDNTTDLTLFFVIRIKELTDILELGLLSFPSYDLEISPPNAYWNFKLEENGASSKVITEYYSENEDTIYNDFITVPSIENTTMVLAIRIDGSDGDVFINGVFKDTISISGKPDHTTGSGAILASLDHDGVFVNSLNAQIGEFILYKSALSDNDIVALSNWLSDKWSLS